MKQSSKLKHPVHFVCPKGSLWPELENWQGTPLNDQVLSDRSGGTLHSWSLRTYYHLKLLGENVTVSDTPLRNAINFASIRDLGRKQRKLTAFLLIPQGDAHHSQMANYRILQNGINANHDSVSVIWHWPQPGIRRRDPARKDRVDRLCFKGRLLNLDAAFQADSFISELRNMGVEFEIDAFNGIRGKHNWNDYKNSDAVLAVRNLTVYDANKKPASKLVNAWFAELPAILGPEPAYQEIGTKNEDYLEVRTPNEAIEAIRALKQNPDLFRKIVVNGVKRREAFTEHTITQRWIDVLNGPVAEAFEQWQRLPKLAKVASSVKGIMRESDARKKDKIAITSGKRLLENETTDNQFD